MNYREAIERVYEGERFEDPEILKLTPSNTRTEGPPHPRRPPTNPVEILSWALASAITIAHEQARRGWTTLDPDILSLTTTYGETVLDGMLSNGWKPQTEEEKLIVFTVKASK